jgi:CheY-like chemotaxis protein
LCENAGLDGRARQRVSVRRRRRGPARRPAATAKAPWKIAIVDDEAEVHDVTVLALQGVQFADRGLSFLSARSAGEAKPLLAKDRDVALVLLDVVMETDDAGLGLVRCIREELGDDKVRAVPRHLHRHDGARRPEELSRHDAGHPPQPRGGRRRADPHHRNSRSLRHGTPFIDQMWKFSLLAAAGAARARAGQLYQVVMTKIGRAQPDCRMV